MTAQSNTLRSGGQSSVSESALRVYEFQVLGHLLGRKENLQGIARAAGLPLPIVQQVCQALCAQGKLTVAAQGGEQVYRVVSPRR